MQLEPRRRIVFSWTGGSGGGGGASGATDGAVDPRVLDERCEGAMLPWLLSAPLAQGATTAAPGFMELATSLRLLKSVGL